MEPGKDYIMLKIMILKMRYRVLDYITCKRLEKIDRLKEKNAVDIDKQHRIYQEIKEEIRTIW